MGKGIALEFKKRYPEMFNLYQSKCDDKSFDVGIIDINSLPERFTNYGLIMLDILKRLDYVQPIIISNNGIESIETSNGYQYISS